MLDLYQTICGNEISSETDENNLSLIEIIKDQNKASICSNCPNSLKLK